MGAPYSIRSNHAMGERSFFIAALFKPNHVFNQQFNSSEWPIYGDHSVTHALIESLNYCFETQAA